MTVQPPIVNDFSLMVEDASVSTLTAACIEVLGVTPSREHLLLGLWFMVIDLGDAFDQADVLLDRLGQEESDPFHRDFDIRPFSVSLDVSPQDVIATQGLLLPLADHCARILSRSLRKRVLVVLSSGRIPYRLYRDGGIEDDYARYRKD